METMRADMRPKVAGMNTKRRKRKPVPVKAGANISGNYFSFKTGDEEETPVNHFELKQVNMDITFWREGKAAETFKMAGLKLSGAMDAEVIEENGDIKFSNGLTARKEAELSW